MNTTWTCNYCWNENSIQAANCSSCGDSREKSERRDAANVRKRKLFTLLKIAGALIILLISGYLVSRWNKATNQDYQVRQEKDLVLSSRGIKTQCEVTEYTVRKYHAFVHCTFVADDKEYQSGGSAPQNYRPQTQWDESTRKAALLPGSFVNVEYDPQNPSLNRVEGDSFVANQLVSPLSVLKMLLIFVVVLVAYGIAVFGLGYLKSTAK